jgi:hypothetical protein
MGATRANALEELEYGSFGASGWSSGIEHVAGYE